MHRRANGTAAGKGRKGRRYGTGPDGRNEPNVAEGSFVYPWRNCPSICLECIIKKESERERERERHRERGGSPEIGIARKKDEVCLQMQTGDRKEKNRT
jgi:hypothetical protein